MKYKILAFALLASALVLLGAVVRFSMLMRFALLVPAFICAALGFALLRGQGAGKRRTSLAFASVLALGVIWLPLLWAWLSVDPRH